MTSKYEQLDSQINILELETEKLEKERDSLNELMNKNRQKLKILCDLKKASKQFEIMQRELEDIDKKIEDEQIIYWAVEATPNDSIHIEHIVAVYKTEEEAKELLSKTGSSSYDDEDRVSWVYSIIKVDSSENSLKNPPSYFPYCG